MKVFATASREARFDQALVVFLGTGLSLAIPAFSVLNVIFVVIWLGVCTGIAKEHKKLTPEG